MAKTTVDVDPEKITKAQAILGTDTIKDTVDAALRQVIADAARRDFVAMAAAGVFAELLEPETEHRIWS